MVHSEANSADVTILPAGFKAFVRRRLQEISGILSLVIIAIVALSLASWTITDPSLNHAIDTPAKNYLGTFGAIIADLGMQFLGLSTVFLLAPPLIWTFRVIRHVKSGRKFLRGSFWILSTILFAGILAIVPAPANWPLPTGLGGIIGDKVMAVIFWMFTSVLRSTGLAIICTIVCLLASCATLLFHALKIPTYDHIDDNPGKLTQGGVDIAVRSLGAFGHIRLSLRSFFTRSIGRFQGFIRSPSTTPTHVFTKSPMTRFGLFWQWIARLVETREPAPSNRIEPVFEQGAYMDSQSQAYDGNHHMAHEDIGPEDTAHINVGVQPQAIKQVAKPKRGRRIRNYKFPHVSLLSAPKARGANPELAPRLLQENARALEGVLEDFGVRGEIISVNPGPVVTLYELEPAAGIKSSRVIGLADDIARSMSAISARVAVIPGKNAIGIELPNTTRETVYLRELIASEVFNITDNSLPMALGKTIGGEPVIVDLARMPHLLIAGTTGSGKSVGINTMILSLLYTLTPEQCRMIMIDPKMLELSVYDGIPHLLAPVVTDPKKAVVALKWTVQEMEDRYKKMSKIGVRNIDGFNERVKQAAANGDVLSRTVQTGFDNSTGQPVFEQEAMDLEPMPYIVVIVDEMADLMMVAGKDIEGTVQRLAQMARAAGIHMITATQRPSVDVITGTIKANFPTRISFQVTSKIDSRTILGEQGAEQLLGRGDMLFMAGGGRISRVHGPFVSDMEVETIVKHLKKQGVPEYLEAITEDSENNNDAAPGGDTGSSGNDLYDQAVAIVARDKKASTSYIQRRLSIGYNRAATIIEQMEADGVISPANHAGKREVLIGEPGEGVRL